MNAKSYSLHGEAQNTRKCGLFGLLKYLSLLFCLLLLIASIVLIVLGPDLIDKLPLLNEEEQLSELSLERIKNFYNTAAIATILITALGSLGILGEKVYLTTIYVIYLLVALFGTIWATEVWAFCPSGLVSLAFFTGAGLVYNFLLVRKCSEEPFDGPPSFVA